MAVIILLETAIIPLSLHTFQNAEYRDIENYIFFFPVVLYGYKILFSYFEEGQ
jgi:hypothetical protein